MDISIVAAVGLTGVRTNLLAAGPDAAPAVTDFSAGKGTGRRLCRRRRLQQLMRLAVTSHGLESGN